MSHSSAQSPISFYFFLSRQANARAKAEQADLASEQSRRDSEVARVKAKEFAPEFHQPGTYHGNSDVRRMMTSHHARYGASSFVEFLSPY